MPQVWPPPKKNPHLSGSVIKPVLFKGRLYVPSQPEWLKRDQETKSWGLWSDNSLVEVKIDPVLCVGKVFGSIA